MWLLRTEWVGWFEAGGSSHKREGRLGESHQRWTTSTVKGSHPSVLSREVNLAGVGKLVGV